MKRLFKILIAAITVIRLVGWQIERLINRVDQSKPLPQPSYKALDLHKNRLITDVHNDTLLFERDITQCSTIGHINKTRLSLTKSAS